MKFLSHPFFFSLKKKLKKITLLQLVILLLAAGTAVFVVKYYGKKGEWRTIQIQVVGKNWIDSYYAYEGYRPPYWFASKISPHDFEINLNGKKTAEITNVETFNRGGTDYDMYVTAKLFGVVNTRLNQYVYNGQQIVTGAPIELRLNSALLQGQIIDDNVYPGKYKASTITARLRQRSAEPWIVQSIREGDTMTDGTKQVAKILSFQTEPTQSELFFTQPAVGLMTQPAVGLMIERNPRLKDVILNVQLEVITYKDEMFFGGHQNVKVGNAIWLYFPSVNLRGLEIEYINDAQPQDIPR